jgi:hypothetical protein
MASTTCWKCLRVAHMTPVEGSAAVERHALYEDIMGCFRCDGCGALNIAIARRWSAKQDPLTWLAGKKNAEWKPQPLRPVVVKTFPDVPAEIAQAASEAHRCLQVSGRAAVLMARSVIEATAKHKGVTKGRLIDKIDALTDLVRSHVRDGAHQIRLLGNDMAHGDFTQDVSSEDANLVLTLMDEVLNDVYRSPAKVARAQAAREARKQQEATLAAFLEQAKASPALESALRTIVVNPPAPTNEGQEGPAKFV